MREHRASGWTAESLALHLQAVIQGSFILAKAKGSAAAAAESLEHLKRYVELLFRAPVQSGRKRRPHSTKRMIERSMLGPGLSCRAWRVQAESSRSRGARRATRRSGGTWGSLSFAGLLTWGFGWSRVYLPWATSFGAGYDPRFEPVCEIGVTPDQPHIWSSRVERLHLDFRFRRRGSEGGTILRCGV